jgi:hypothetical protein
MLPRLELMVRLVPLARRARGVLLATLVPKVPRVTVVCLVTLVRMVALPLFVDLQVWLDPRERRETVDIRGQSECRDLVVPRARTVSMARLDRLVHQAPRVTKALLELVELLVMLDLVAPRETRETMVPLVLTVLLEIKVPREKLERPDPRVPLVREGLLVPKERLVW